MQKARQRDQQAPIGRNIMIFVCLMKDLTWRDSDSNSHSHNPTTREEHLDIDFDQYIEDDDDHDEPSRDDDVAEHQYSVPSSPRGPPQGVSRSF